MAKILILGGTGMLGCAVTELFSALPEHHITVTYRTENLIAAPDSIYFDALTSSPDSLPGGFDYVINCIGVIKPFMAADPAGAIRINSLFPWQLAAWSRQTGARLIHITTDCVYSGSKGKYVESDLHDALDDYGKSKSLGECTDAMVLRTSIIGEELHKHASLVAWAKSQRGKTVGGFSTHLWNGVTTRQYARICRQIIEQGLYAQGLYHIFAADDVSKYQMLHYFNEKYDLGLTIEEKRPEAVDRTLRTEKDLCGRLAVPTVKEMIMEM